MRRVPLLAVLLCAGLPFLAHAITADELIAKNIAARGGADKLKAVQSFKATGTFKPGGGVELAVTQFLKRGMARDELSLQGLTIIQAYDGKDAWQVNPLQGRKDPERMTADDSKSLVDEADIDGPLVDYRKKGHKVEYLGTEDVDGSDAHKLRVLEANGDKRIVYLDSDHFLAIRVLYQRQMHGREVEFEADLGAYEQVAGVYLPFEVAVGPKGSPQKAQMILDKVEANVPMDEAIFRFPAAK
jgi:hypothetical protein